MDNLSTVSDFWLEDDHLQSYVQHDDDNSVFGIASSEVGSHQTQLFTFDLIQLSCFRKAISNFVYILTKKSIPVRFNQIGVNAAKNGEEIFLSTQLKKKKDFDFSVGLSLHEGTHIVNSDFSILRNLSSQIPRSLFDLGESKGISKEETEGNLFYIFNVVEDFYVDDWVYRTTPGYRGYCKELHDKIDGDEKIIVALKSDLFRLPTVKSYEFRITFINHISSDFSALPKLTEIYHLIDPPSIHRLTTTLDRLSVAKQILEIVYENIFPCQNSSTNDVSNTIRKIQSKLDKNTKYSDDFFDDESSEKVDSNSNTDQKVLSQNCIGEDSGISKTKIKEIKSSVEKVKSYIKGDSDYLKVGLTPDQQSLLDVIEKSGVTISSSSVETENSPEMLKVDCILVKNLTEGLIQSDMFPLKLCNENSFSKKSLVGGKNAVSEEFVVEGIRLGTLLGRKIRIRKEINTLKFTRRKSGKIDKRLLSDVGWGSENIFFVTQIDKYRPIEFHISVDASSSMKDGKKWGATMVLVVALAKAASMINNLHVSISFRGSCSVSGMNHLPYIVLAYDSKLDKFSKIRQLFPYLYPNGGTPEGLCFEPIVKNFVNRKSGESNYYFCNVSDGEPCFYVKRGDETVSYNLKTGGKHTKTQVDKLRSSGYKILSYFVGNESPREDLMDTFRKMYGKDSKFIDVGDIMQISNTLNRLFLDKT